ncbi:MAG: alpha/beta fold hydrolase [Epsilonproteobacteria bacterium]|nr:alpha/beta fold hydrolase [Campylobacterota bacterium]
MWLWKTLLLGGLLLFLGCGGDRAMEKGGEVVLDLPRGAFPFPSRFFSLASKGRESPDSPLLQELSRLDGFSTTAPITIGTTTLIDPASAQGRIHIYKVERDGLQEFPHFLPIAQRDRIVLLLQRPLEGGQRYIVALDRGIVDVDGALLESDRNWRSLLDPEIAPDPGLAPFKPITQELLHLTRRSKDDTIAIWDFPTQTIGARVARLLEADYYSSVAMELWPTGLSSHQALTMAGVANEMPPIDRLYTGLLHNLPYFLATPSPSDPTAPLHKGMDLDDPQRRSIPVLASIPSHCPMPPSGWPVVIFLHGITKDRTALLAIAPTLAKICHAVVAIDLPLHGISDPSNPFYMASFERTFDLDLMENGTRMAGADGNIDPSGSWYINLANPAISRDNMLQSSADLAALRVALQRFKGPDGMGFDPDRIYLLGHSLGAMVPIPYLSQHPLPAAVLANPGGGIAQLLAHSKTFAPLIEEALQREGIEPGSKEYERYLLLAQTLLDDADPINYGSKLTRHPLLLLEVVGDEVIPNRVLEAPLSGTEPLAREMGAVNILAASFPLQERPYLVKYAYGEHGSLLRPTYPEVTASMQSLVASYFASRAKELSLDRELLSQ